MNRKTFSSLRLAFSASCVLSLFALSTRGQGRGRDNYEAVEHPNGLVQDWSHRHALYPRVGPIQSLIAVQNNSRAIQSWQAAARSEWRERNNRPFRHAAKGSMHTDWSISLGTGTTAPFMYPAKFGFDVNAAPNCSSDFIIFPVNAVGSSSQPNIVAFNNLYSGTAGGTGICNAPSNGRTAGANDDGVSATTYWSYNVHAAGGKVATSPVLSLDGTKVAFVETKSTGAAHFHVLAWKSGDGVATNAQNVLLPKTINSSFSATAPLAGSGMVSDLALGTTSDDTLSSPFFEYGRDLAYVGNDTGTLFRIKDVFCLFPSCTGAGSPAPSFDGTWGTGGALSTGCTGKLTGPVVDGMTGSVFVGCSDGKLYGFTETGVAITPLIVGNGSATGGIVDSPMVDGTNGVVYAVSGDNGTNAVIVEAKSSDLSLISTATLGAGGLKSLHLPAFNQLYGSSGNPATWLLYEAAPTASGVTVFGIGFSIVGGVRVMNSGTPPPVTNQLSFGIGTLETSPLTEFVGTGNQDRFFGSALSPFAGILASFNITATFPTTFEHSIPEGSGTTAIVIDNVSALGQADSIYFGVLGSNTAVKLTQAGLQ